MGSSFVFFVFICYHIFYHKMTFVKILSLVVAASASKDKIFRCNCDNFRNSSQGVCTDYNQAKDEYNSTDGKVGFFNRAVNATNSTNTTNFCFYNGTAGTGFDWVNADPLDPRYNCDANNTQNATCFWCLASKQKNPNQCKGNDDGNGASSMGYV